MSKKKLTEGLESLFAELGQEVLESSSQAQGVVVRDKKEPSSPARDYQPEPERRSTGKKFADDLESLLQMAFEDSFDRQKNKGLSELEEATLKKRSHRPMSGLDSLIRTTVDPSQMRYEEFPTRRLTIVFDEKKLSKLKEIARTEKTVLRDIIDEIVAGFILEYERKKKNTL
jgi:hypothetical protein